MWTGDNSARWDNLEASIKMCLSVSVGGKNLKIKKKSFL